MDKMSLNRIILKWGGGSIHSGQHRVSNKTHMEGMAHFFSSCWSVGLHRTFAQKDMTIVLDYPPEFKCKILLLNTTTYLSHKT